MVSNLGSGRRPGGPGGEEVGHAVHLRRPPERQADPAGGGAQAFEVVHGFPYRDQYDDDRLYTVSVPTRTDLASVPFFLQWLVLSYGQHTMAAIVHDEYWDDNKTRAELRQANTAFRHAMWESDVPYLRRWFMWTAVTLAMLTKSKSVGRGSRLGARAGDGLGRPRSPATDVILVLDVPAWVAGGGVVAALAVVFWVARDRLPRRRLQEGGVRPRRSCWPSCPVQPGRPHRLGRRTRGRWRSIALVVAIGAWGPLVAAGFFATLEVAIILAAGPGHRRRADPLRHPGMVMLGLL